MQQPATAETGGGNQRVTEYVKNLEGCEMRAGLGLRLRPSDLTLLSPFMGQFSALLRSINEYAKCLFLYYFGNASITKSEIVGE